MNRNAHKLMLILLTAVFLVGCTNISPVTQVASTPFPQATQAPLSLVTHTPVPQPSLALTPTAETPISSDIGFKIVLAAETGEGSISGEIYFLGNYAVEMSLDAPKPEVVYHLPRMSWREVEANQTIEFSDCLAWAAASAKTTKESLAASTDETAKRFTESLLEPKFEIKTSGTGEITLQNEFLSYRITPAQSVDEAVMGDFFAYDQLNACRKALVLRQLPPFAQLAVTEELKHRAVFPSAIAFTMKTTKGDVVVRLLYSVEEITDAEYTLVKSVLNDQ